jgi:hypothetical protein
VPNIIVWFLFGGGAAGVPNIMVVLPGRSASAGSGSGCFSARAVKTCPQRVH